MDLSESLVLEIIQSNEAFPVNFDDAWKWIGYSKKANAKVAFQGAGFLEGIDFRFLLISQQKSGRGRPSNKIKLTIEAFKSWAMMAGTPRGKEVRAYFLKCEAELKRRLEAERQGKQAYQIKDYVLDKPLPWKVAEDGQRPFTTEFYENLYRIRGGSWAKRNPKSGQKPGCVAGWTNKFVYDMFPEGVPKALYEQYKLYKATRSRQYELLTKDQGRSYLHTHMAVLLGVMRISPSNNWSRFLSNVQTAIPNPHDISGIQLEFKFLLELEEEWGRNQEEKGA
jgi:phage anti-repressor protein